MLYVLPSYLSCSFSPELIACLAGAVEGLLSVVAVLRVLVTVVVIVDTLVLWRTLTERPWTLAIVGSAWKHVHILK